MLSSIHPLGERGKGNRFGLTAGAFLVGAVAGGAATGIVVAGLGAGLRAAAGPSDDVALAVVGALALAAAVAEWRGVGLPSLRRQVDENWLTTYRGWVYGAGFGFQLGAGVLTYITSAAVFVALGASVLAGSPLAAVAIMTVFGLVRGLSLLPAGRITTSERLFSFHRTLHRTAPAVQRTATATLAVTAIVAVTALV